jgi:hypothetical protein
VTPEIVPEGGVAAGCPGGRDTEAEAVAVEDDGRASTWGPVGAVLPGRARTTGVGPGGCKCLNTTIPKVTHACIHMNAINTSLTTTVKPTAWA